MREDALNIPNLLTFGRILMIPLCLWFLDQNTPLSGVWAAIIFTLAAITDLLDGYLARKLNVVSVLGKLIDPLADKLIVMATLVWMVPMGRRPAWAVAWFAWERRPSAAWWCAAQPGQPVPSGRPGGLLPDFLHLRPQRRDCHVHSRSGPHEPHRCLHR